MHKPTVKFSVLSFEENVEIVSWSVIDTTGPLQISEMTYNMFPNLIGKINENMDKETIKQIVGDNIKEDYDSNLDKMNEEVIRYQKIWDEYDSEYMEGLSNVLNIKWNEEDNIINGYVGYIPVCPRYISDKTFSMSINASKEHLVGVTAHETCHFLYFDKWKELNKDWEWYQFDSPNMIWYLSEMVVDPIMNKTSLNTKHGYSFKAYDNFYNIEIGNEKMMDTIKSIYNTNKIEDAINKSYEYVINNENEIRMQCNDESNIKLKSK